LELSNTELQSVKEGVGKSKAEGTYTNLCYANRMLCEFIKDLGSTDIEIRSITEELFEEYRFFLKKKGLKGSSINNYLCWLSRLMFRAVSQRIIRYNPFEHAEYEKVEKAIRFLSKSDVKNLMAMKMCDSDAELARRMFIFSCFTGLAITDNQERNGREDVYKKGASENKSRIYSAVTSHSKDDYRAAKAATSGERRRQ